MIRYEGVCPKCGKDTDFIRHHGQRGITCLSCFAEWSDSTETNKDKDVSMKEPLGPYYITDAPFDFDTGRSVHLCLIADVSSTIIIHNNDMGELAREYINSDGDKRTAVGERLLTAISQYLGVEPFDPAETRPRLPYTSEKPILGRWRIDEFDDDPNVGKNGGGSLVAELVGEDLTSEFAHIVVVDDDGGAYIRDQAQMHRPACVEVEWCIGDVVRP